MVAQQSRFTGEITPDTMLPDLLGRHPGTRPVLDRYGLRGCGGHFGPVESIGFFARAHGVDETRLLRELTTAAASRSVALPVEPPSIADTIYRRFFIAAIVIVLTAGATWGAWLLWSIGFAGTFTGVSVHQINAHGHAQIYGWVGLFIMGFACQAFPRLWHVELAWPRAAVAAFAAMVGGIILRTVGMTAAGAGSWAVQLALAGGLLELAAILIFAAQIATTYRRSPAATQRIEPYVAFIFMGLFWFIAMCGLDLFHTYATMTAASQEALIWYISTYQAPLRDLQIHGLSLFMILGVGQRMLPALFGVPATPRARAWKAFGLLTFAVAGEVATFLTYRFTGNHVIAALLMLPWIALVAGAATIVLPWKLWRKLPIDDRSGKFIRASFLWLGISLAMLLLLPVYQAASGIPFSHAYYGAIRHAITVGFISLMIIGIASKVAATMNGLDTRALNSLWGPFLLINLGCFLRVAMQTLTDFNGVFFPLVGISGTLEVLALAWWGLHMLSILREGRRASLERAHADPRDDLPIGVASIVASVIAHHPQTLAVFVRHGLWALSNPLLRNTLARAVTIGAAARMHGLDADALIRDLRAAAGQPDRRAPARAPALAAVTCDSPPEPGR